MNEQAQRAAFWAAVALLWAIFFVQALHAPTVLDDWYQLAWHHHHPFGLSSIWQEGYYDYFHFNPRIGDELLLIVNGPRAYQLVLTPLVELALLAFAFAVTFARWPRACLRDLQLLLVLQVLIWLVVPVPGIVYFYRPFATNYLWSFAILLGLFIPYRFELARAPGAARHWLVPLLLPIGWLAGMGNEHTGPTAIVVMLGLLVWAVRKHRVRPWMASGALGLLIGCPMLLFAPGQAERYGGVATTETPLHLILSRGFTGNGEILLQFIGEAQLAVVLVLAALLLAHARAKRTGASLAALPAASVAACCVFAASAGSMVVTQFASPAYGERLFFAPGVLLACGLALVAEWLFASSLARRVLIGASLAAFAFNAISFVSEYWRGYAENQHRLALLQAAPAGSIAKVPPYRMWQRTRWWWGDDFQFALVREYVGNEVYDLRGIELAPHAPWAEATPTEQFVAVRTFEPPLSPADDAKLATSYVPTYREWAVQQMRRELVMGPLGHVPGHRLVRYEVDDTGTQLDDPRHRPVQVFTWERGGKPSFVDGRPYDDPSGRPFIRLWGHSVPADAADDYIVGCGRTTPVQSVPDREEHVGPMLPVPLDCRGVFTAYVCEPTTCWFAGRYER